MGVFMALLGQYMCKQSNREAWLYTNLCFTTRIIVECFFGLHKQWQLCSMELKFAINAYLLVAANARQASVSWMSQQESDVTIMATKVAKDLL